MTRQFLERKNISTAKGILLEREYQPDSLYVFHFPALEAFLS